MLPYPHQSWHAQVVAVCGLSSLCTDTRDIQSTLRCQRQPAGNQPIVFLEQLVAPLPTRVEFLCVRTIENSTTENTKLTSPVSPRPRSTPSPRMHSPLIVTECIPQPQRVPEKVFKPVRVARPRLSINLCLAPRRITPRRSSNPRAVISNKTISSWNRHHWLRLRLQVDAFLKKIRFSERVACHGYPTLTLEL